MYHVQEISSQIFSVGGSDRRLERFENMFPIPNGVSYNSYLIADEKTALLDTVDSAISSLFLENVKQTLNGRKLDYLIVSHMEPDHCANIEAIVKTYPDVKVVGNAKTFQFIKQFFCFDISEKFQEVKEGDELSLGAHTLKFYFAPMVHWPEVLFAYEMTKGILFTADAFGSFGALSGNLFYDQIDSKESFLEEARRYYTNIVGKYGVQVQNVLKKISSLNITMLCPLHGLLWRDGDIAKIVGKYQKWSLYEPEKEGIVLFYASMYGNTEYAINTLSNKLSQRGIHDMQIYDVSKTHASYIISDAFKYSHMIMAAPTYNLNLYYPMDSLLREMSALGLKNRKVSLIGNYSWASAAIKVMQEILATMKNIEIIGTPLDIRSSLKLDQEAELEVLADTIYASLKAEA